MAKKQIPIYQYTTKDWQALEKFIESGIGKYDFVYHELASPDIHCDIYVINPTKEYPFYRLLTFGAGAYKMKVPGKLTREQSAELARAEYMISLPVNWDLELKNDTSYWPVKILKTAARLPIMCKTWLGFGHTVQYDEDITQCYPGTNFNSFLVSEFTENNKRSLTAQLPSGKLVNFYQLIPLYPQELEYALNNSSIELLDKLEQQKHFEVIDPNRKTVI